MNDKIARSCKDCRFKEMEMIPGQLIRQMVCHRDPPRVVLVPMAAGMQMMTLHPVVQESQWCYKFEPNKVELVK